MPEYSAVFSLNERPANISLEDYFAWWQELGSYIIPACDRFEIDCHMNDIEGLKSCARLSALKSAERVSAGSVEVWCGTIDRNFANEFLIDPFDEENNRIKWFNVFLRYGKHVIMSVAQNGQEIGLHKLNDDDIEFLQELAQHYDLSFYYWKHVESGEIVPFIEFANRDDDA